MVNDRSRYRWVIVGVLGAAFGIGATSAPIHAQRVASDVSTQPATRPPTDIDPRVAALAARPVRVSVTDVSVQEALEKIAAQAKLTLAFSPPTLAGLPTVSARLVNVPVSEAFEYVLRGTGLRVIITANGRANVALQGDVHVQEGIISGVVIDSATRKPIAGVTVAVQGTNLRTLTDVAGKFALHAVPLGDRSIHVRAFGYGPVDRLLSVSDTGATTIRVVLAPVATVLTGVVTTVAGRQRKLEVGNDISTIDVDSVMRTAPITTFTDLLSGRVPGLEVLPSSGQVGAVARLRLRGSSSLSLTNDPIVVIDGVRFNNQSRQPPPGSIGVSTALSPLADLPPEDIESIEIVKGPSATTLYGTDAANGVIVVTTKHGREGATQWDLSIPFGPTKSGTAQNIPETWQAFGHTTDGSATLVHCLLVDQPGGPYFTPGVPGGIAGLDDGSCVVDSVTHFSTLNSPALSVLGEGWDTRINGSVSGGSAKLHFFLSGNIDNATSGLSLPKSAIQQAKVQGLHLSDDVLHPNKAEIRSVQSTFSATPIAGLDVASNTSLTINSTRDVDESHLMQTLFGGNGQPDSAFTDMFFRRIPLSALFNEVTNTDTKRIIQTFNGTWAPWSWINVHGVAGADYATMNATDIQPPDPNAFPFPISGNYAQRTGSSAAYSGDIGATVTHALSNMWMSSTTAGSQYVRQTQDMVVSQGSPLSLGNTTLNGAANRSVYQEGLTTATLGSYVQEQASFNQRLWMTAAVRLDGGSGFGGLYTIATYPKADMSLLAYQRGQTSLRLRASFGKSGNQAPIDSKERLFYFDQGLANGVPVSGAAFSSVGNALLRPERSSEFETGFDLTTLDNRLDLTVTPYWKKTIDELFSGYSPTSVGFFSRPENLGDVTNRGIEASMTLRPIDTRALSFDMTMSGSYNANRLVRLSPFIDSLNSRGGGAIRYVAGYPLGGVWGRQVSYDDADHNGRLTPSEVTIDSVPHFLGPSTAPRQLTLSTGISLLNHALRITTLFNSQSGNIIYTQNGYANAACGSFFSISYGRACNDTAAPLALQAAGIAAGITGPNYTGSGEPTLTSFMFKGWVARFQELGVNYAIPVQYLRNVRFLATRTADVSLSVRNLKTWTHYPGVDPSVGSTLFGDDVADYGSLPQPRTWQMRVHVGW